MKIWKKSDLVDITFGGKTVHGTVAHASPNGRSLTLTFEELAGYAVCMLVFEESGVFRNLILQSEVTLSEPDALRS